MGPEQVDRFLDEALAAYSCAQPRPGIEGRILGRVASVRGRWKWMAAGLSVCAVGALCVALLVVVPKPAITIVPLPIRAETLPILPPIPVREPRERSVRPAPLTKEERAWMSLGESGVLASVELDDFAPLRVDDLAIPPLESEGGE